MRTIFAALCALLLSLSMATAQDKLKLGDEGFEHDKYHDLYQQFFGKAKCHCSSGQCRPSAWRSAPRTAKNTSGIEVYVSGLWCPVDERVLLKQHLLSPDVWRQLGEGGHTAHVCAYPQIDQGICPSIECAVILSGS